MAEDSSESIEKTTLVKRALALGAAHGINHKTTVDWDKQVPDLTEGSGVDHVVEVGGGETLNRSIRTIRMGGSIWIIGALTQRENFQLLSKVKFERMNAVYRSYFKEPRPARTTVVAAKLVGPGHIEITVTARK